MYLLITMHLPYCKRTCSRRPCDETSVYGAHKQREGLAEHFSSLSTQLISSLKSNSLTLATKYTGVAQFYFIQRLYLFPLKRRKNLLFLYEIYSLSAQAIMT